MTEEQYENLMYALSTLIGLLKRESRPTPAVGIDLKTIEQIYESQLKSEADKVHSKLMTRYKNKKLAGKTTGEE